jgi:nucleoside-triphosphatase THEP1
VVPDHDRLILWTGQRHSGKTTMAANLARVAVHEGFEVAGLLALSVYCGGSLVGFDGFDLCSKSRAPLLRHGLDTGKPDMFTFVTEGLKLGAAALSLIATESADLIIVDEFGPFELNHQGWRISVDALLTSSDATILLVVRQQLAGQVQRLYASIPSCVLAAAHPQAVNEVIRILRDRSTVHRAAK